MGTGAGFRVCISYSNQSDMQERKKPPYPIPIQGNYKIRRVFEYKDATVTAWASI